MRIRQVDHCCRIGDSTWNVIVAIAASGTFDEKTAKMKSPNFYPSIFIRVSFLFYECAIPIELEKFLGPLKF